MALNITDEQPPREIPSLVVEEVEPGGQGGGGTGGSGPHTPGVIVRPGDAPPEPPPAFPTAATEMPPVAAAGVGLATFVLSIAAGSIVLLILYLLVMDFAVARNIHDAYKQVLNPSRLGAEFYTMDSLEKLSIDLKAARDDPSKSMSSESEQNAQRIMGVLDRLPSLTSTQKVQLKDCINPLLEDASRNEKLDRCLSIIEEIRQATLEAAAGVANAQVAGEFANKINEQRQSLHTFWIQVAQLILLNLLLPLLTALLGYIFGTQQAQRVS